MNNELIQKKVLRNLLYLTFKWISCPFLYCLIVWKLKYGKWMRVLFMPNYQDSLLNSTYEMCFIFFLFSLIFNSDRKLLLKILICKCTFLWIESFEQYNVSLRRIHFVFDGIQLIIGELHFCFVKMFYSVQSENSLSFTF